MSAPDRQLLAMLLAAEEVSPAEKALQRLLTLMRNAAHRMEPHDLRYFEIALEGLGMPARQRRLEIEAVIQVKRDWLMARRAAMEGGAREAP